jgi:signal transduction histidine kinase
VLTALAALAALACGFALGALACWTARFSARRARRDDAAALMASVGIGVLAWDTEGHLVQVDEFARHLFGGPVPGVAREVPAERWLGGVELYEVDGVTRLAPERSPFARALREGGLDGAEYVIAARTGTPRRVRVYARPRPGGAGMVAVVHDVTAGRAEWTGPDPAGAGPAGPDEAGPAEALTRLEAFAGMVSHDLKGPLVAVSGYAQILRHLAAAEAHPAEYDEYLAEIVDGVETMHRLIDSHLALATTSGAPPRRAAVVARSVATRHANHRRYTGEPVPMIAIDPVPPVLGEAGMLQQVVENLICNAMKYTRPGVAPELRISGRLDGSGDVLVEFVDRGVGVPEGQRDQIFVTFHRAHSDAGYPGTGLGLAISRDIIERHGGRIGCLPNPGGGTRFWITLPAAADAAVPLGGRPGSARQLGEAAVA